MMRPILTCPVAALSLCGCATQAGARHPAATLGMFFAFGARVLSTGALALGTVSAFTVRFGFWVMHALLLARMLNRRLP